eukprot:3902831-Rhodomonas_salina.1
MSAGKGSERTMPRQKSTLSTNVPRLCAAALVFCLGVLLGRSDMTVQSHSRAGTATHQKALQEHLQPTGLAVPVSAAVPSLGSEST